MKYRGKWNLIRNIVAGMVIVFTSLLFHSNDIAMAQENAQKINDQIFSLNFSNDTYAGTQWAIDNPGYYYNPIKSGQTMKISQADVDMDVIEAWKNHPAKGTREVVVAIIDTGVDINHPDLKDHIWVNPGEIPNDGIDNDNNGYIDDVHGWDFYNNDATVSHYIYLNDNQKYIADPNDNDDHGTHIAGIIGVVANNNIGIAGIASNINIKIMPLKINGGPDSVGKISKAIEAIKYATMMGADICNLSWGTNDYIAELEEVMRESDMLFVAAAGNKGVDNNKNPIYPANLELDNLISVTFIDAKGKLTALSNYGSTTVDLAAPGEDIISTTVGGYGSMSGTSMAAPHVSAIAALLYSYSDNPYPANIKEIILNNIKKLPSLEGKVLYPGIPSAYNNLLAVKEQLISDSMPPVMNIETVYEQENMKITIQAEDIGTSNIRTLKWIYGKRTLEDFKRGTQGSNIKNGQLNVTKAGFYTFYISDYAGNEAISVYEVKADEKAPKLTLNYKVADNYKTRTITVRAKDEESGIKRIKYMAGSKKAKDFLPSGAGTEIELNDGKGSFKVKKDGVYTVFVTDYRGNNTVKEIQVKTVKTTDLKLARSNVTMRIGDQYDLLAYVKPVKYTDQLTYSSSDKDVVTVTKNGTIKAIKEGEARIVVRTSSGLQKLCKVTVVETLKDNGKNIATLNNSIIKRQIYVKNTIKYSRNGNAII